MIIQEATTLEVLMLGYMNKQALWQTLSTKRVHFWSRAQGKLWLKGEQSGHYQEVFEIRIDCDGDALLIKVNQLGAGACHLGYKSCFFRKAELPSCNLIKVEEPAFNPQEVYKNK